MPRSGRCAIFNPSTALAAPRSRRSPHRHRADGRAPSTLAVTGEAQAENGFEGVNPHLTLLLIKGKGRGNIRGVLRWSSPGPVPAASAELRYCPDKKVIVKVCPFGQSGFGFGRLPHIG